MASPAADAQPEDARHAAREHSHASAAAVQEGAVAGAKLAAALGDDDNGSSGADGAKTTTATTTTTTQSAADDEQSASKTGEEEADPEDGEIEASNAPPPLPQEPVPDDGWDCQFDANTQAWFFYNRFTGKTQWDNPRVPASTTAPAAAPSSSEPPPPLPQPPAHEAAPAGGYNPAIHGDYDPNAWYAKGADGDGDGEDGGGGGSAAGMMGAEEAADMYAATATFNRYTGGFQSEDMGPGRHSDEAKARRQMNAYFDADSASAAHDGRSLKAERQGKKPSKAEVKAFKEKRRARKEEKRRAWLMD